jgi:hypothetical protein
MKKVFIFGGLIVALTVAGSAFALLGGGGEKVDPGVSAAVLAPESVVGGQEVAVATEGSRKCGSQASRSRCGSSASGGGCCGGSSAATDIELLRTQLQAYYAKTIDGEITVDVKDLGCHQEAEIRQNDRVIKRISISGREITELT